MFKWPLLILVCSEQEVRLKQEIAEIEKDTGYKLRVLAQNYPVTPGLLYVLSSLPSSKFDFWIKTRFYCF